MARNNQQFLQVILNSFKAFIDSGTSRSTQKLKPLHGAIAKDIQEELGNGYEVWSQGFEKDKEAEINGRYINKKVDITIKKDGIAIAGIAVKFVMQNYSQNSNNYFENMLGETANIRSNKFPYFQVFVILDKLPYYDKQGKIKKWESFTDHNASKYLVLSTDNTEAFYHTPNKTLIYVVHVPVDEYVTDKNEYLSHFKSCPINMTLSTHSLKCKGGNVIVNDYEEFINKVYHTIMAM